MASLEANGRGLHDRQSRPVGFMVPEVRTALTILISVLTEMLWSIGGAVKTVVTLTAMFASGSLQIGAVLQRMPESTGQRGRERPNYPGKSNAREVHVKLDRGFGVPQR